jgi:LytS/YehU family sensor histidine kinase
LEQEKVEMELNALKMQVNPHFLFNSLNSIYSLALVQSAQTPDAVLKLSGLLRFILYEAEGERISLDKELELIRDFISLQQLRIPKGKADIRVEIEGKTEGIFIAPLLLLPLMENAFKHGVKGETGASFVHFNLAIIQQKIMVTIRNNQGLVDEIAGAKYGGIGLENVRKRLELLYPNAHVLAINSTEKDFEIKLILGE